MVRTQLILDGEYVLELAVPTLGPDVIAGLGLGKLGRDPAPGLPPCARYLRLHIAHPMSGPRPSRRPPDP